MLTNTLNATVFDSEKMSSLLDGSQWENNNKIWHTHKEYGTLIPKSELIIFKKTIENINKKWLMHIANEDVETINAIFVFYEKYNYFGVAVDIPNAWGNRDSHQEERLCNFVTESLRKLNMDFC